VKTPNSPKKLIRLSQILLFRHTSQENPNVLNHFWSKKPVTSDNSSLQKTNVPISSPKKLEAEIEFSNTLEWTPKWLKLLKMKQLLLEPPTHRYTATKRLHLNLNNHKMKK
jgi:hypothetical protein